MELYWSRREERWCVLQMKVVLIYCNKLSSHICRWKQNSIIDKEVKHTEAPLSLACSRLLRTVSNNSVFKSATAKEAHWPLSFEVFILDSTEYYGHYGSRERTSISTFQFLRRTFLIQKFQLTIHVNHF